MGWTSIRTKKSIEEVYNYELQSIASKSVKSVFVSVPKRHWDDNDCEEKEQYIAYRTTNGKIAAVVILWKKDSSDVYWKEMEESVGPYTKTKCPKEIMALLSPVNELEYPGYANEWRSKQ